MALAREKPRDHIYELDPIRGLTAVGVVGVHVTAFSIFLLHTPLGVELQYGVVSALHFTREIFISITAFLMVYVYGNRPFPIKKFWRKRGVGVFIPYAVWSLVYTWLNFPHASPLLWLGTLAFNILFGNASFQLYYILLTLELYLALPWILPWLARLGRHPWRLLLASGAVQVVLLALAYHFVEVTPFAQTPFGNFLVNLQDRFLPLYQFYIVVGGLGAMYRTQVQSWVLRHGKLVLAGFVGGLALLWGALVWQVNVQHQPAQYGADVFQPVMVFYAVGVAAFAYWRASVWARRRFPAKPWGYGFWHLLSDASFGVYLMHPLLLNPALSWLAPNLPALWPEALCVFLVWMLVAGGTVALCSLMLATPGLSRLVGHPCVVDWSRVGWATSAREVVVGFGEKMRLGLPGPRTALPLAQTAGAADHDVSGLLAFGSEEPPLVAPREGAHGTEHHTR